VEYYRVYRGEETCTNLTYIETVSRFDPSLRDTDVDPGQRYCYAVEAVNEGGSSDLATVTATPELRADPAVTDLTVEKTELRADYTDPVVNPVAPQEIEVTISNLGDHPTEDDGHGQHSYGVTVLVCPEEADNRRVQDLKENTSLDGRCETVGTFDGDMLAANASTTFETEWDPTGNAGDHEVIATLTYDRPEVDENNDEDRSETFVIVGGTSAGGIGVDESEPPVDGVAEGVPSPAEGAAGPVASETGSSTPSVEVAPASFGPAAPGLFLGTFASVLLSFARR